MTDVPEARFRSRGQDAPDFEILSLEELRRRQERVLHRLDRPHRLDFFSIILVTRGEGAHSVDFREYPVGPGAIVFVARGQVHAFDPSREIAGYQLLFTEGFLRAHAIWPEAFTLFGIGSAGLREPVLKAECRDAEDFTRVAEALERESARKRDAIRDEAVATLLKLFLLKAERLAASFAPAMADAPWLDLYLAFMDALRSRGSARRGVSDYAATLGVSPKRLNAACKEAAALTAKECVDRFIVLEAKRALSMPDRAIAEIADSLGFGEPTNFTKFFKARAGLTPTDFRASVLLER
jgi:AraC-like DNA-binding protein